MRGVKGLSEKIAAARARVDLVEPRLSMVDRLELLAPFRLRGLIELDKPVGSIRRALRLVKQGRISLLEYVYASILLASRFRVDPTLIVGGLRESEDGSLELILKPDVPLLPRRVARRLISCVNKLVSGLGYKEAPRELTRKYVVDAYKVIRLLYTRPRGGGRGYAGGLESLEQVVDGVRFRLWSEQVNRGGYEVRLGVGKLIVSCLNVEEGGHRVLIGSHDLIRVEEKDTGLRRAVLISPGLIELFEGVIDSGSVVDLVVFGGDNSPGVRASRLVVASSICEAPRVRNGRVVSLGSFVIDSRDPVLRLIKKHEGVRFYLFAAPRPSSYSPRVGDANVIYPSPDQNDEVGLEVRVRACVICGNLTYSHKCDACGATTKPTRFCKVCKRAMKDSLCPTCKSRTYERRRVRVRFSRELRKATRQLGLKGTLRVKPMPSFYNEATGSTPEDLRKGVLRFKHDLRVYFDGTSRVGFRVVEYDKLGGFDIVLPRHAANLLVRQASFINEELTKIYGLEPQYEIGRVEDLVGELLVVLHPRSSIGVVGRVVGVTSQPVGFTGFVIGGGVVTVTLALDYLLNYVTPFTLDTAPWGVPFRVVGLGDTEISQDVAKRVQDLEGITHHSPLSSLTFDRFNKLPRLVRLLRSQVRFLSMLPEGLRARVLAGGVLARLLKDVDLLLREYLRTGFTCGNCGCYVRRATLTSRCPECNGVLKPIADRDQLEAARTVLHGLTKLVGTGSALDLAISVDRIFEPSRQYKLTDFL